MILVTPGPTRMSHVHTRIPLCLLPGDFVSSTNGNVQSCHSTQDTVVTCDTVAAVDSEVSSIARAAQQLKDLSGSDNDNWVCNLTTFLQGC